MPTPPSFLSLRRLAGYAVLGFCGTLSATATEVDLLVTGGLLMTIAPGEEEPYEGYLAVDSTGKIAAIGAGAPPADLTAAETIDASGKFVIPGLISAHSHVYQSAYRGLAVNELLRGWLVELRKAREDATAEDYYWFTLHGYLDHLRHGITSVYNFTGGGDAPDFQEQQLKAGLDSGVRFVHAWSRSRSAPQEDQRASFEKFYGFAEPFFEDPLFLKLSISGTYREPENVALDAALTREYNLVNQTHFLEHPRDIPEQQANFESFLAADALGPSLYFGHFIHTTDAMLEAVGKVGGGMSWNPLSNGRLASGIADIPKYLEYGLNIGMGVDGQASADLPDPFENMRMGLYYIRATYKDAAIMSPYDVLRFHTLGSATVMNVADQVGSLEVGKYADFLLIDPAIVDRAPIFDAYATLVFACNTQNLAGVYVGGELVSAYCKLTASDFAPVQKELYERVGDLPAKFE